MDKIQKPSNPKCDMLSRVLVTNNVGSGLYERVYLLLIHTSRLLVTQLKHRTYNSATKLHTPNITHKAFSSQPHSCR
jgi:hypothetical protein